MASLFAYLMFCSGILNRLAEARCTEWCGPLMRYPGLRGMRVKQAF